MNRAEILRDILKNKTDITDSTARVYVATLASIAKHFNWTNTTYFTSKYQEIIDYASTLTPQRAKAILSAVLSVSVTKKASDAYKKKMVDIGERCREDEAKQEKSKAQEENWESWDTVMKVYRELEEDASPLFKRDKLSPSQMKLLQHYIILSCYVLIPPRRISDYINFKVKNIEPKVDNWYDEKTGELVFNQYKTSKSYGTQRVDCSKALAEVFTKWIPIASRYSDFLLFNSYGNALTQPQLTKTINSIFGKNISASMLRHIYISDVTLKDVPKLAELEKVAHDMGHSTEEQMMYKKFN